MSDSVSVISGEQVDVDIDSQVPEPTNWDIMRKLDSIHTSLNSKLESLAGTVEKLQGEVFDLQEDNKKLTKELANSVKPS